MRRRALKAGPACPAAKKSRLTADAIMGRLRKQHKKIVFTNGCFDLIHAGHVQYLNQARTFGDALIVGLNSDASVRKLKGPGRPILPLRERRQVLEGLRAVDAVIPFGEPTPARLIRRVQPDVLIKGGDWSADRIVGADTVLERGGKVISGIFIKGRSTTEIIRQIRRGERRK